MAEYHLLVSKFNRGVTHLVPLSNQTCIKWTPPNAQENVEVPTNFMELDSKSEAARVARGKPLNSIFITDGLEVNGTTKSIGVTLKKTAPLIYVTTPGAASSVEEDKRLTPEMRRAYEDYCAKNGLTDNASTARAAAEPPKTMFANLTKDHRVDPPTIDEDEFYVDPDIWYYLVRNSKKARNTLLTGPTGTGKTEIIELLSKKLEKTLHVQDMGSMHDSIGSLLGVHRLEGNQSIFDPADFVHQIQDKSAHILLDEISRSPAGTNNILFSVLDRRRALHLSIATSKTERLVKVHEDVAFFATANLGSEYTGTHAIDRALLDRFEIIELGYLQPAHEAHILRKRTDIGDREAGRIITIFNNIRNLHKDGRISTGISIRYALQAAELVVDGMSMMKALELTILPLYEGDPNDTDNEKSAIKAVLISK